MGRLLELDDAKWMHDFDKIYRGENFVTCHREHQNLCCCNRLPVRAVTIGISRIVLRRQQLMNTCEAFNDVTQI